jgi:PAS domain S-box-containing protein
VTGAPWATALAGTAAVELSGEKEAEPSGLVWLPYHSAGRRGVLHLKVALAPREDPNSRSVLLFLKFFGLVGGGVFCYYFLRYLLQLLFTRPSTPKTPVENESETGFVIDTFQGLIQQLKQKEQALERLKGEAEDHAKSMESYNENILQSVTSGVLVFDCEKTVTTFNTAAGEILKVSPEWAVEKSYEAIFGKNRKMTLLLDETLQEEKEGFRLECEVERPDGRKIWLGMNMSLLRDRNDQMIGAILIFTDLTQMKLLQDQVELKKRLAVMGEMSAWIAHEFRNYMATIFGFARLLSKKMEGNDPRQGMINSITNELSAMERLITELLSYGRKTALHTAAVALVPLLEELREQFVATGSYSHIRWSFSFREHIPDISLDPLLIRQALSNLIQNALEAMEDEGILHLRVDLRPEGMVRIEITDTGRGISKENLDKVFLPFFTTKEKGTGLGLALVHKIILSHNGQIFIESIEGKGTTFMINLPLRTQPVEMKE